MKANNNCVKYEYNLAFTISQTVALISHMVYTILHRGYAFLSVDIGNNGLE